MNICCVIIYTPHSYKKSPLHFVSDVSVDTEYSVKSIQSQEN